uniref:Uncharacterized protein n=1 Tax=Nelumbo nucifera TaxID=4432 RepID=A0A822Y547_NELNU|nr:TPA_asm: hypothetical protein HUJ06_027917 [Nelumbo nucifera]
MDDMLKAKAEDVKGSRDWRKHLVFRVLSNKPVRVAGLKDFLVKAWKLKANKENTKFGVDSYLIRHLKRPGNQYFLVNLGISMTMLSLFRDVLRTSPRRNTDWVLLTVGFEYMNWSFDRGLLFQSRSGGGIDNETDEEKKQALSRYNMAHYSDDLRSEAGLPTDSEFLESSRQNS